VEFHPNFRILLNLILRTNAVKNRNLLGHITELLHIIGLVESVRGGKQIIVRPEPAERDAGSLLENTISQIELQEKLNGISNLSSYGAKKDDQLFNIALHLSITWINRILFLKLFEAKLLAFHQGDDRYVFLNSTKIKRFDDLNILCFQVIACPIAQRDPAIQKIYSRIPYLNCPLFEPTSLELQSIGLNALPDLTKRISIQSTTVLTDGSGARRQGRLPTIEYLLDFLNEFNFASTTSNEIQEDCRNPINAATLGLVFEKINGYKDGAFFTPGFVTMHMCRETLRKAAIQKFNACKNWQCKSIDDLRAAIKDRSEANEIINALRICDPSVGTGHFLVAALNEIIAIKSDLGILHDKAGVIFQGIRVGIIDDELVIRNEKGAQPDCRLHGLQNKRVQEVLFSEKKSIIENCLFGVDINPDSVRICRLRLWIELLKHACFDVDGNLQALPDIAMNIKSGNSTVSRFSLDTDLEKVLESRKGDHVDSNLAKIYSNAFEWRCEFPGVLDGAGNFTGFDAVITNPPYIDSEAMATAGQTDMRRYLTKNYLCAKGNWDLYIVFLELGFNLLSQTGVMSFITPDKWISKSFGNAFRKRHIDGIESITVLGRDVFERALIDSIIVQVSKMPVTSVSAFLFQKEEVILPLNSISKSELDSPYYLAPLVSPHFDFIVKLDNIKGRLKDIIQCENACATSDAYKLKPLVGELAGEFDQAKNYLLVNTGTLGKYVSRWGIREMTYLKDRYLRPVVNRHEFSTCFTNTYKTKSAAKKIIVKGLTLLDATLDLRGDMIPGKTTLVLMSDDDDTLKYVAAVLNSPLAIFYIKAKYGSASYNGGITFTKEMLNSLPLPANRTKMRAVTDAVNMILERKIKDHEANSGDLESAINQHLYALYELTPGDVAMIEALRG
jgi:hypothetical protein